MVLDHEAMWIKFEGRHRFAIKIYPGGLNALTGLPMKETPATRARRQMHRATDQQIQDYVVVPEQKWLDGIATDNGIVRQFVATSMDKGHTVEAQVTGEEVVGGLQFEIVPLKPLKPLMIIVATLTGQRHTIYPDPRATVEDLKALIMQVTGTPLDQQRIIFAGKQLEDGKND